MNHIDANDLEQVSALADGELDAADAGLVVDLIGRSGKAMAAWQSYHVLGDILRCPDMSVSTDARAFAARVRSRLDAATVSAALQTVGAARPQAVAPLPAANDPTVRWKWLAAAACFLAVVSLGWQVGLVEQKSAAGESVESHGDSPVASRATTISPAPADPAVMLRDARLDELMAAHQQLGGTGAFQTPSGFLRNATFESPARR